MRFIRSFILFSLIAGLLGGTLPALAATSFSFLFSRDSVRDDNQFFLNLAVSDSGYNRATLEPVLPRIAYLEADLPVILFVARECGRPVDFIVDMRSRGMTWTVIFRELHVSMDTLFVGIDQDPGPPYGKAWGYWKQNPREPRLSDQEISGLVRVQLGSRLAGVSPSEIASSRGRSVEVIVADKKGRPHGQGGAQHSKKSGKAKGKKGGPGR